MKVNWVRCQPENSHSFSVFISTDMFRWQSIITYFRHFTSPHLVLESSHSFFTRLSTQKIWIQLCRMRFKPRRDQLIEGHPIWVWIRLFSLYRKKKIEAAMHSWILRPEISSHCWRWDEDKKGNGKESQRKSHVNIHCYWQNILLRFWSFIWEMVAIVRGKHRLIASRMWLKSR